MKFNMYSFCVLFLILSNSVGNQGDPFQGQGHSKTQKVPSYLVSVRNISDCHICAGSMLSENWVITSKPGCVMANHIMPGLTKLTSCNAPEEDKYYNNIEYNGIPMSEPTSRFYLYKVMKFDSKVKPLGLSKHSPPPPGKTGTVMGWSFENNEFVFTQINNVSFTKAFGNPNESFKETFYKLSLGSPLIYDGRIYGFYMNDMTAFFNVRLHMEWIAKAIEINK